MSLKDYYKSEKTNYLRLRNAICERLGISKETFYIRLKLNNWSPIEKDAISEITGESVDQLFPETVES